jgi:nicotinamidase-related amidase
MGKVALLVIDIQNKLISREPFEIIEVISNVKKLIETCRENDKEVIFIQHNGGAGSGMEPYSDGWNFYEEVAPRANDKVLSKNYCSSFRETELKEYLEYRNIDQLIITGMQTEYCIDTTCKVAFEHGYKVIIPEKTNTTFNNGEFLAKDLYKFYNYHILNNTFGVVENIEKTIERIVAN